MQTKQMDEDGTAPTFLYKVLSADDWQASQGQESIKLSVADHDFIHLAKEDQLERIIDKFWGNAPEYVVLKIRTDVLPGKLVYEANPGGENKYYHLYSGAIPLSSVLEAKIVNAR